jgi:MFS family permease
MQPTASSSEILSPDSVTLRAAWYMLAVIVLLVILSYIDRAVLSLFAHPIQEQLQISDSGMGVLFGLGFIAPLALTTILVGWAADRYNRVAIIIAGVAVWSLATGLSGLAGSFTMLLLARGLMGLGEATIGPAGYAMVASTFPPERRGRAMGVIAGAVSVGSGAALVIGGLMLEALGDESRSLPAIGIVEPWQMAYLLLGAVGIPAILLALTLRDRRARGVGTAAHAPADWSFLKCGGAVYTGVFVCAALNVAVGTGVVAWSPTMLVRDFGMVPSDAGYVLGAMSIVGGLIGPPLAAELSDRWLRAGRPRGRMHGHVVLFMTLALGVVILVLSPNPAVGAGGLLLVTLSLGAINAVSYAAVPDLTPAAMTGRMLASLQFISLAAGYGSGPSLVAAFTDHVYDDKAMLGAALLSVSLPLCATGALIALATGRRYVAVAERINEATR